MNEKCLMVIFTDLLIIQVLLIQQHEDLLRFPILQKTSEDSLLSSRAKTSRAANCVSSSWYDLGDKGGHECYITASPESEVGSWEWSPFIYLFRKVGFKCRTFNKTINSLNYCKICMYLNKYPEPRQGPWIKIHGSTSTARWLSI